MIKCGRHDGRPQLNPQPADPGLRALGLQRLSPSESCVKRVSPGTAMMLARLPKQKTRGSDTPFWATSRITSSGGVESKAKAFLLGTQAPAHPKGLLSTTSRRACAAPALELAWKGTQLSVDPGSSS